MNQNLSDAGRASGRVRRVVWGALAGLALGAALMWVGVYFTHDRDQAAAIHGLEDRLLQAQAEADSLHAQRDVLEGQLLVESSTRKGLETTLDVVQNELGSARDQIAFFNELLPPGPEGSISIRGLDFQQKGSILNYRVLLMRNGAGTKPFDGMLQFQANGRLAGDPVTVILESVRAQIPENTFDVTIAGAVRTADAANVSTVMGAGPEGATDVSTVNGEGSEDATDARTEDAEGDSAVMGEGADGADSQPADDPAPDGNDVDEPPPNSILSLAFDQFQRSSGVLQIPEGVELEDVTLNVFEGQTLRLSRTVELPAQQLQH